MKKDQRDLINYCHDLDLQDNPVLTSPFKEIQVEHLYGEVYKAYMILEDGTRIWCNFGCIGDHSYSKPFDVEKTKAGWKKDLENFWFNRKKNCGVLVR